MQSHRLQQSHQRKYAGMVQIVRFNWPVYAAALALCGATLAALALFSAPNRLRWLAWSILTCTIYWIVASLLASHWVYDRSGICKWTWIKETLPSLPRRWTSIHAGLDESSAALKQMFPESKGVMIDVFDPAEMTEPCISKARTTTTSPVPAQKADFRALPLNECELDTVFLIFAAHEIRRPESRLIFFQELRRVLKPGGVILLVEHLRDFTNFLAFGPGFFHFQSRREWLKAAHDANLGLEKEFAFTPFVRIFLLRKPT